MLWNCITQPEAAEVARNSFSNNYVESDLVNSYGWDTAIVFIQAYSKDNNAYSKQLSKNTSLANTGVNNDKVCNIHDMASNCSEWSTETSICSGGPCSNRDAGIARYADNYTAIRWYYVNSKRDTSDGYRPLLYVK